MAVSTGNKINAYEFNLLQVRVSNILGNGFSQIGYGQAVSSSQVKPPSDYNTEDADIITAAQFNNLRSDIAKIYTHQNGTELPIPQFDSSNIIGATQSGLSVSIDENNDVTIDPATAESLQGFNSIISAVDLLEQNRFQVAASQTVTDLLFQDSRETSFNGAVSTEFRLTFSTADQRRYFFNSGGQIRIAGNATSLASSDRNAAWNDLLQDPGTVVFGYNYTRLPSEDTNGVSLSADTGNYQLTSNYQVIFEKQSDSAVYSESYWQIEIKENDSKSIDIKITLVDPGEVNGEIEPVTANLEFDIEGRKASGVVQVDYPVYQIISTFED